MNIKPYNPNMSLSEKLGLGLPKNDPFIRAINIAVICLLVILCAGNAHGAEPAKPADNVHAEPKPDPVAALTKERDDLKAQAQNLQVANQYLSVLAERNEMAIRLLQANSRADDLQKQLEAEKAKVTTLEAEKAKWDEALKKSVDAGLLKK